MAKTAFLIIGLLALLAGLSFTLYFFQVKYRCVSEGEFGNQFDGDVCCEGLTRISTSHPPDEGEEGAKTDSGEICVPAIPGGGFFCGKCGDGKCTLKENKCNCPEDCK